MVSVTEAAELIRAGEAVYVDVRMPHEYAAGHAPGAINVPVLLPGPEEGSRIPNEEFAAQASEALRDPSAPVLVACFGGARGPLGAEKLRQAGFSNVRVMEGGYSGWAKAGLPIAKDRE